MPEHPQRLSGDWERLGRILDLPDVTFVCLPNEILEVLHFDRSHCVQDARDAVQGVTVRLPSARAFSHGWQRPTDDRQNGTDSSSA
jgi:hypothetical protein